MMSDKNSCIRRTDPQIVFLFAIVTGLEAAFLGFTLEQATLQTLSLLVFVSFGGLLLITRLQRQLGDSRLKLLGYVWLVKLLLTLFVLYAGWVPQLDPASDPSWGYDPQRYYAQAQDLVENVFQLPLYSINYAGILYYYAIIFALLGHNPVIPALVNAFITLLATLVLVRVGYEIKQSRTSRDWLLGLAMVIPEVLWFDVMTSRETLMAALLTVMMLLIGRYCVGLRRHLSPAALAIIAITGLGIGLVRTPMLIPVAGTLALYPFLLRRFQGNILKTLTITGILCVAIYYAFIWGSSLVSSEFALAENIAGALGKQELTEMEGMQWSEQSIGQLLIPDNAFQSVLFAIPRGVLYLLSPLPQIEFNLSELLQGSWKSWQSLMMTLSSILNVCLFPLALASLVWTVQGKSRHTKALAMVIPFWTILLSIVGGNQIIHDRYRVMGTLLLWGNIWLGMYCPHALIRSAYFVWGSILGAGILFYAIYKMVL
jgi:hypothetical protein